MDAFNRLSPAAAERLAKLTEELGEVQQEVGKVQQAIGKVLIHGYHSVHPSTLIDNQAALERELGDLLAAVDRLVQSQDLNAAAIQARRQHKLTTALRYLHHQDPTDGIAAPP